jgi:hypothetical protein
MGALIYDQRIVVERYILPRTGKNLNRIIAFWLFAFSIAFVIYTFALNFKKTSGLSQIRMASSILIEIMIGTPLLFISSKIIRRGVTFQSILRIVILVDGFYLVVVAILHVPLELIKIHYLFDKVIIEKNVISNAISECYSNSSTLLWLLRGNMEFGVVRYAYKNNIWKFVFDNSDVVFGVIFVIMTAFLLRKTFKIPIYVGLIVSIFSFLIAARSFVLARDYLEKREFEDPTCLNKGWNTVASSYNVNFLSTQLVPVLNSEFSQRQKPSIFSDISFVNDAYVTTSRPSVDDFLHKDLASYASVYLTTWYCTDKSFFSFARKLNKNLTWLLIDERNEQVAYKIDLTPESCSNKRSQ